MTEDVFDEIPILIYRKSRFAEGQVTAPPRTYEEAAALGETRRRTADLGFSMHLRKPVPFEVLQAALRGVLPATAYLRLKAASRCRDAAGRGDPGSLNRGTRDISACRMS